MARIQFLVSKLSYAVDEAIKKKNQTTLISEVMQKCDLQVAACRPLIHCLSALVTVSGP